MGNWEIRIFWKGFICFHNAALTGPINERPGKVNVSGNFVNQCLNV